MTKRTRSQKKKYSQASTAGGTHPHPESLYFAIASKALQHAKTLMPGRTDEEVFIRKGAILTAMVFSALCLEAFINQEYHSHSETSKVLQDNDLMPLGTKWLMLPLLLGAEKTFDTGRYPFQTFADLLRVRNQRLVHFKPAKETRLSGKSDSEPDFSKLVDDIARAEKYVNCVADMIRELARLTSGQTSVPRFLEGAKYLTEVWATAVTRYEAS